MSCRPPVTEVVAKVVAARAAAGVQATEGAAGVEGVGAAAKVAAAATAREDLDSAEEVNLCP